MKYFNTLSDAKRFIAGLEQFQTRGRRFSFIQSNAGVFLDALGDTVRPKIKAVPLSSTDSLVRMGLYAQSQGRRPGRKREVPNTRKIGGLVVDESVAPAHGLFEYCLDLGVESPPLPPFSTPVRQIIRTDGVTWQALLRDAGTDAFAVVEEYDLPAFGHGLEWMMDRQGGALFDVPQELYGFIEFLRRAMIADGKEKAFSRRIATYGRELVYWLMAAEDAPRLERFVHEFCPEHNLSIGTLAPEFHAAKILSYCMVMDAVMEGLSALNVHPEDADTRMRIDWLAIAQCDRQAIPMGILRTIVETIRVDKDFFLTTDKCCDDVDMEWHVDARATTFCSTLWRELGGRDNGIESFSGNAQSPEAKWAKDVLSASSGIWQGKNANPFFVNINAGVGNCAAEIAQTMSRTATPFVLSAGDPDPVASQILRFRLLMRHHFPASGNHAQAYYAAFGEPVVPDSLIMRPTIMLCDCHFLFQHPSGAKASGNEFLRRLEQAFAFIERYPRAVASLRVPVDFLDGKEYELSRLRLLSSNRAVWVRYDEMQKRPRDKRIVSAFATIMLDAAGDNTLTPSGEYKKLEANPDLRYSLMPPRLSGDYLGWPALTDIAAVPPFTGPVERRGMTLIDTDADALARRVHEYLSPNLEDEFIADRHPLMMRDAGRFKAHLSRRKIREKTVFNAEHLEPYPFRPFDERVAYLREMRPLFSDPAPDLQVIASIPDNWFLLSSEGDKGIEDGLAAWASTRPCDYDYFSGRSRHFPVRVPDATLKGTPIRSAHGRRKRPETMSPKANLSKNARHFLEQLNYPDPDEDAGSASILWDFALAVLYTPAYSGENQAALRLSWPRVPLPGWGKRRLPGDARNVIEEYAAHGRTIRGILAGAELEHRDILSGMATVRFDEKNESVDPSSLDDAQRTLSADWGVPAKGNAVRMRDGALAIKWTGGTLLKRSLELADAMNLPAAECLERLGENCADGRINQNLCFVDIPGAAWDFNIGGRKILNKWLSYRDVRVMQHPMTPQEMHQFSDIARRLVVLTLLGVRLDLLWRRLLDVCGK